MSEVRTVEAQEDIHIDSRQLNLSGLVGREISVFSTQYPGKELKTKVLAYAGDEIQINAAGGDGRIGSLVGPQTVTIRFIYKGEEVSVRADVKRSQGGRCFLRLDRKVVPLSRRRFHRVRMESNVSLAAYPTASFKAVDIKKLRWVQTRTINFSSGGAMIPLGNYLQPDVLLLMHIDLEDPLLPEFVLARVCHCYQTELNQYIIGVEFIVRENWERRPDREKLVALPRAVFSYTAVSRARLNQKVIEMDRDLKKA
jgi:hypothetical protein